MIIFVTLLLPTDSNPYHDATNTNILLHTYPSNLEILGLKAGKCTAKAQIKLLPRVYRERLVLVRLTQRGKGRLDVLLRDCRELWRPCEYECLGYMIFTKLQYVASAYGLVISI